MDQKERELRNTYQTEFHNIFAAWKDFKKRGITIFKQSKLRKEVLDHALKNRMISNDHGSIYLDLERHASQYLEQENFKQDPLQHNTIVTYLNAIISTLFDPKMRIYTTILTMVGIYLPFAFFLEVIKASSSTEIFVISFLLMGAFTVLFLIHKLYFRDRCTERIFNPAFNNLKLVLTQQEQTLKRKIKAIQPKKIYYQLLRYLQCNLMPLPLKNVINSFSEEGLGQLLQCTIEIKHPLFRPQCFLIKEYFYQVYIIKMKKRVYLCSSKQDHLLSIIKDKIILIKNQLFSLQNTIYLLIGTDSAIFTILCEIDSKIKDGLYTIILYSFTICLVIGLHGKHIKECYGNRQQPWRKWTFFLLNIAFLGNIITGLLVALSLSLNADNP